MTSGKQRPVEGGASRALRVCGCSRPLRESEALCGECADTLRRVLVNAAEVGADLQITMLRQDRLTVGGSGRAAGSPPMPVNLSASYALQRLFDAVRAFTEAPPAANHSLYMLARLAVLALPALLKFPQIVPLANELHDAVKRARYLMDRPGQLVYTGPCGAIVDDVECFEELWAAKDEVQVHCRVCGTTWDVQVRRLAALSVIADQVVTPELLSRALTNFQVQVTRQDLHYWWKKGLIIRCVDEHGRSSYLAGQVIAAWDIMQERGRGRKKKASAA